MEGMGFEYQPTEYSNKSSNKGKFLVIFLLLLIIGVGGYFAGKTLLKGSPAPTPIVKAPVPTEIPTAVPTATPSGTITPTTKKTPTPTVKPTTSQAGGLDRSALSITVQNGSGTAGAASKIATYLKGLGYTVAATGNADNFDYTNVTISVKPAFSKYLTQLKSDLSSQYTIGSTSATLTGSSDAIVIIGK